MLVIREHVNGQYTANWLGISASLWETNALGLRQTVLQQP